MPIFVIAARPFTLFVYFDMALDALGFDQHETIGIDNQVINLRRFIIESEFEVVDDQHLLVIFICAAQEKGDIRLLLLTSNRLR